MLFADSEVQKLLRDSARSFLADTYSWDRLYAFEASHAPSLPRDTIVQFANMGWLGLVAAEEHGGGGLSLVEAAVIIEELGYSAVPANVTVSNVAAALLTAAGETDRLAALAAGTQVYTVSQATRARERPVPGVTPLQVTGGVVSGTLPAVPHAAASDFVLAPLSVDGEQALGIVALGSATITPAHELDRATYSHVAFNGASASTIEVLARGSEATAIAERGDTLMTAFGLMEMSGAMQRILKMTTEYISNRVQFGQPVAKFQAARHRAAEMLMYTDTTRWAAYKGLWDYETSGDSSGIYRTKLWADKAVNNVFENSHMLHGGVGVGIEFPLHLFTAVIAAGAVRDGAANEVSRRVVDSLGVAAG